MKHVKLIFEVLLYFNVTCAITALHKGFMDWMSSFLRTPEQNTHHRAKRNLFNFESVINCYQPWVDVLHTYADYGCFCGYLGSGIPLDETDLCCWHHDACYREAEELEESTWGGSYVAAYNFNCTSAGASSKAVCADDGSNSVLEQKLCECDIQAAECFTSVRWSYNPQFYNIDAKRHCSGKDEDLAGLFTDQHILTRLYSCPLRFYEDKCCKGKGYNSVYEVCCSGKIEPKTSTSCKIGIN